MKNNYGSKLRRQRSYWRNKEIKSTETENKHLSCIGFDGKIDKTLVMNESNKTGTSLIHHHVLVAFLQNSYIDHGSPETDKADNISIEIIFVIASTDSTESLEAVVCGGTNVPC